MSLCTMASTQDPLMHTFMLFFARLVLLHVIGAFIVDYVLYFRLKSFFPENTQRWRSGEGLKVIACGFPRSGTRSLKLALDRLGFHCYHGSNLLIPSHPKLWLEVAETGKLGHILQSLLDGYTAIVDLPATCFYKELMAAYPDAKIILNVRDPEKWYQSFHRTIYWSHRLLLERMFARRLWKLLEVALFQGKFDGRFEEKEFAIGKYTDHMEEVKRSVPKEKLLVYDVREGWSPLCDFLEVEIPEDVAFPATNDTASYQRIALASAHLKQLVLGLYLAIFFCTISFLLQWLYALWF